MNEEVSSVAVAAAAGEETGVEARDAFLRVHWSAPAKGWADYHYFWLRHNCDCCRHPQTGERTICSSTVPMEIRPRSVALSPDGGAVVVVWAENGETHRSEYRLVWLAEHAYATNREAVAPPGDDVSRLEVARKLVAPAVASRGVCLETLQRYGAAIVRGAGLDTEAIIDSFAEAGLTVIGTHFGRIEDLRTDNTTNSNTDQLGYTDAPVNLHTDQPFLDVPPRFQMLHCMQPAEVGGDSYIADGKQAALYLRSLDAAAFGMLTTVTVRFHRKQKAFERLVVSPIVELRNDDVYRIRSSYFTMDPHRVPFERMEQWYRAYNRFAHLVNDPRHQYRFRLEAGDFLLYDNYRMLHARTGFSGSRWVRGVYFNP